MNEEVYLSFLQHWFECPANFDIIDFYLDCDDEEAQEFCRLCDNHDCHACWQKTVQVWARNNLPINKENSK